MTKPARAQEISVQSSRSLGSSLSSINNFLFSLNQASQSKIDTIKTKLKNAFNSSTNNTSRSLSSRESHRNFNKVLTEILLEATKPPVFFSNDPAKLFEKISSTKITNIKPYIGKIARESLLYNKDLVTGLEYSAHGFVISYRLDFDESKHLHLNMSFLIDNETYLFTLTNIQVKEETRFYVPPTTHNNYNKDISNKSREIQERMIKLKFSIKMTSYCLLNRCHPTPSAENVFVSNLKYLRLNYKDFISLLKDHVSRTNFINGMMQLYADKAEGKIKESKTSKFFLPLKSCTLPQNNVDSETKSDSENSCDSPRCK